MPDVFNNEIYLFNKIIYTFFSGFIGTIIGYDQFKVFIGLTFIAPKNFLQPFGMIVGANDHRNA